MKRNGAGYFDPQALVFGCMFWYDGISCVQEQGLRTYTGKFRLVKV